MNRRFLPGAAVAAALLAAPAAAQNGIDDVCRGGIPAAAADACAVVAQAVDAAQPQLGILLAGGNPTLGTASTGGVRLGFLPRVGVTGRLSVVGARLPDIREVRRGGDGAVEVDRFTVPAPALGATLSVGVTEGTSLAPMLGGFGAVDLLGSVSLLPLGVAGGDFGDNVFSWGGGARMGILRESFLTPGVSLSVMYRRLGDVSFGDVCPGTELPTAEGRALCAEDGDFGEIRFGLDNVSARAAVSKRLLGLGLTGGLGWDRFSTDAALAFRAPAPPVGQEEVYRFEDVSVRNTRWSGFLNLSYTLLVGSLVGEVGWMQGASPIQGFPSRSDFDPRDGTWFGSLGARLAL